LPPIRGSFFTQVALIAFVVLLASAGSAQAGTMYVYSCHTPTGAPAGTAGWTHTEAPSRAYASNDCASGPTGALFAQSFGADTFRPPVFFVAWGFLAAANTRITSFSASVCPQAAGGAAHVSWPSPNHGQTEFRRFPDGASISSTMFCHGASPFWTDPRNTVQRQGLNTEQVWFVASCFLCEPASVRGSIEVSSFRADVRDDHAPVVTSVRGPLASNLSHTGTESVEFNVVDTGVGVYRAVVEARVLGQGDWIALATSPLGQSRASCRELDVTSHPYEFDDPQPCELSVTGARVEFNTDSLPQGEHEVRIVVEDAAGNRTPVVTPRKFISKGPAAVAAPALTSARPSTLRIEGAARRTLSSSAFRLRGRLTEVDGRPLSGVALKVRTRPFLPKPDLATGEWTVLGQVLTNKDGLFSARIPAGASRTVEVFREAGDGLAATAAHTNVVVPARVTAKARSARIRNGQSAVFTGQVGGPIPPGGVLVALEVREPKRWIPVATTRRWVRTSASGRFRLAYRFRRTFQTSTYRFRVVAAEDSALTYSRGASRSIHIQVRP
jgi:hypothetical protein